MDEYVIINKSSLLKRIEELEKAGRLKANLIKQTSFIEVCITKLI